MASVALGARLIPVIRQQLDKLTSREYEIAGLIARGFSNQEIAQCLTLEITSVRRYVSRILDKTGLRDRTQIVITWFQAGMSDWRSLTGCSGHRKAKSRKDDEFQSEAFADLMKLKLGLELRT